MFQKRTTYISSFKGRLKETGAMLLIALAAIGCAKEHPRFNEEDYWADLCGDKPLRFGSSVSETKATTELVDGSTFGVFAFFQEGDVENGTVAHWSATRQPNFMFNQQVEKNGGAYTYSPLRYWPSNEENTISFWAYSPYNASAVLYEKNTTNTYTKTSQDLPDIKFTATTGRDDFMTSALVTDKTYANCDPVDGVVGLEFHHRLSWIEFKAKTFDDYDDVTLEVTSVKIIKDYSSGVFRQGNSSWEDLSNERENANAAVAFTGAVELEYATAKSCSTNPVLLIPQDMDHGTGAGKVTVIINYNQKDGSFNINKQAEIELDSVPGIDEWQQNKKYVYTFTIATNDAINLSVQVQPWEYWLGTSDYTESVTITKQLTWDPDTFEAGTGSNCTNEATFTIDGVEGTYKVLVLKPGTNLVGSFIFDTPYQGTWYAMLESIQGSEDGSIVFSNNSLMVEGMVGSESRIEIKAKGNTSTSQYAILRFMCRTVPVDPSNPSSSQSLYVNPISIGGQFVIKQNIN